MCSRCCHSYRLPAGDPRPRSTVGGHHLKRVQQASCEGEVVPCTFFGLSRSLRPSRCRCHAMRHPRFHPLLPSTPLLAEHAHKSGVSGASSRAMVPHRAPFWPGFAAPPYKPPRTRANVPYRALGPGPSRTLIGRRPGTRRPAIRVFLPGRPRSTKTSPYLPSHL